MRIGTRGSALALAQARQVADALGGEHELVEVTTTGDRGEARVDKERWVRELDAALLDGDDRLRRALGQGRARRSSPRAS